MTSKLSLYLHIPFCVKKCDYCAFYSLSGVADDVKQEYFEALVRQLDFLEADREIQTIYLGGGTPPVLGVLRLCKLIEHIRTRFILSPDCEITVEVNPKTVDFNDLSALYLSGANRLSVGVQSANDDILRSIGRIHSFSDAADCIGDAYRAGFKNVSTDVIFALPSLTAETLKQTLELIMSTNVDHISAYSLQLEEGTPLYARRGSLVLPDEECEEEQYELICDTLKSNRFSHYEVSSFAKPGFESRHNLNYWACGEYFGLGAGAHSFYKGKRFSTPQSVQDYISHSRISLLAPTDYDASPFQTDYDLYEESIMLGLRTSRGAVIPPEKRNAASRIASLGFGDFDGVTLRLNSKGFRVSNAVIAEILG